MNATACHSKWQCSLNGLNGTAVFVSVMVLGWLAVELLATDPAQNIAKLLWLWVVPFGPVLMSVLFAWLKRWQSRPMGWFGLIVSMGGAVWGVVMLNATRHL